MKLIYLLSAIALLGTAVSIEAKVYRWKDKNGNWVYSDVPKKGSQQVKLNKPLVMPSTDTSVLSDTKKTKQAFYKAFISTPTDKQTIRDNSGTVYVTGQVQPSFSKGLKVQLYLNGAPAGPQQSNATFVLKNVPRGEHTLRLRVSNSQGKTLANSKEITFFLHKASVGKR